MNNPSSDTYTLKAIEAQAQAEAHNFSLGNKDRSANKTPLQMRKVKRRAQNKVARKSRQLNRK